MTPVRDSADPAIAQTLLQLATEFSARLQESLGKDLVSVVLFGSVARGEAIPTSDIDLLIVMESLPPGRFRRLVLLDPVEATFTEELEQLEGREIFTRLACLLKTREEAERVIPLYLDMVQDAVILFDRGDFFLKLISGLRQRLATLGARRIRAGRVRYWDLKPDFRPGEHFEI